MLSSLCIVPVQAEHKAPIGALLQETGMFRPDEIAVALELIDETLARNGNLTPEDYHTFVALSAERVVGYVCFGKTPMTTSTFDLYWIAVSPSEQGKGIGQRLFEFACQRIQEMGGRLLVIETASQPKYAPTRQFYERMGCTEVARIKDFYSLGDDKLIYTKSL
ncbi:MAG: GNAT family N-acetyltransferase [Chloroherpetonaceae bacterium]|nr:GNAT family N-acetyltransferase [Chloroherpetonaceae bacterium]MCS7210508.1 GNAT family N-acetyltransferase [Chloroherpetonaceae bacterium]MDW8467370.1 GNAT family N-acetyltransferase [Chloroherpetonaceae bacterium]